jgi:hypothetical protein
MVRMRAFASALVGTMTLVMAAGTAATEPSESSPSRIMRCSPVDADGFRAIEIFRDGHSNLGVFEVTPVRGDATTEFVRLSLSKDGAATYLQAQKAGRVAEVGFTFLAKLGAEQEATLHFRVAGQPAKLRFMCDSELTLAIR